MRAAGKDAIEIDPLRCGGKPVIRGTRIPVTVILDQLAAGGSVDTIIGKYPELDREQVVAVLRYCHAMIEHSDLELMPV
ncbi:MAG: DUF433 domain-containing protein [bacterium]